MKISHLFVSACLASLLAGCAYVIPPEESVPRNNTVTGAPHRPQLNLSPSTPQGALPPRVEMTLPHAPAAVAANEAPVMPPVDAATQAQAAKEMAAEVAPATSAPVLNDRHVPVENSQFQVSANTYPSLNSVPPRPAIAGPESTKAHLTDVESTLEQDRAQAAASKETLARDAAAEPSMLSELPATDATAAPVAITPPVAPQPAAVTVPSPSQVRRAPAENSAPVIPHVSAEPVVVTQPVAVASPRVVTPMAMNVPNPSLSSASLPATANFAPPAPLGGMMPAPRVASAAPSVPVASAPIQLKAPVENLPAVAVQELPAPASVPAPVAVAASSKGPRVKQGDFDPLAVADNAPIASAASSTTVTSSNAAYASTGYLSPSRYADRRY